MNLFFVTTGAPGPPGPSWVHYALGYALGPTGALLGAPVVVGAVGGGTAPCAPGACKPAPMDDASKNKLQDAGKNFLSYFTHL